MGAPTHAKGANTSVPPVLDLKAQRAQLLREIVRKKRAEEGGTTLFEDEEDLLYGDTPRLKRPNIDDEENEDAVVGFNQETGLFDDPEQLEDEEPGEKPEESGRPRIHSDINVGVKTPSPDLKEKRRAIRVPVEMRVDYRCNENFLFEYSMNLSQNGIFIKTQSPLPPGTELFLTFSLPNSNEQIKVKGEVIWVNTKKADHDSERTVGMGIRFLEIKAEDRKQIMSLVKRIAIL